MRDRRIFARTSMADAELAKPQGNIKGDDKHLVSLMDGVTDVEALGGKIPPSVRAHMQKILSNLLTAGYITEKERPGISATVKIPVPVITKPTEDDDRQALAQAEIELQASRKSIEQLKDVLREKQENVAKMVKTDAPKLSAEQQRLKDAARAPELARSNEHFDALRGLDFFQTFSNEALLELLKIAEWQFSKSGEPVLREGDAGMNFYVIVSGSAEVCSKGHQLATLSNSDVFGEYSHYSGAQPVRSAQVTTLTDSELLVIDPAELEQCSAKLRLNVAEALLRNQVQRTMLSNQRLDDASDQLDFCKT